MKQTIFGIILGLLLVLTVSVGFEIKKKYEMLSGSNSSTEFTVDEDGVKYRKNI